VTATAQAEVDAYTQYTNRARVRSLDEFVRLPTPKPDWAVEGIWARGAMGVIGAQPKNGKSTFATELAISLATGTPFCQHFPVRARARVLFVQRENSDARVISDFHRILEAHGLGIFHEQIYTDAVWKDEDGVEQSSETVVETFVPTWELEGGEPPTLDVISNADFDLAEAGWREWLWRRVEESGYDYLFLDPYYQVVGANENDPAAIKPVLRYLTQLKNEQGCAAIVTHHESDKTTGEHARRLLGSTYLHGWYEGALFPTRAKGGVFTLEVDALREMGVTEEYVLKGDGVGHWEFLPEAQGHEDALGRRNTQRSQKEIRKAQLRRLLQQEPEWTNADHAAAVGVSDKTLRGYRAEIEAEARVAQTMTGQIALAERG
jgi:hypothetical protein